MNREQIVQVLSGWNFWTHDQEIGVLRPVYLSRLESAASTGQVVVATGVRRAGKSTLFRQYMARMIKQGRPRNSILYVNFEEPRFGDDLNLEFLQEVYEAFLEIVKPAAKPCLFLDELQNVTGWERFVRAIHERGDAELFITGSSARLLSREYGTSLTGRHVDVVVYPLDFREYLAFHKVEPASRLELVTQKTSVRRHLRNYLSEGGFPSVVLSGERSQILAAYLDDILFKDVAVRHGLSKVDKLRSVAKFYLTNIGAASSYRSIGKFTGLSLDSVERFSAHLREAYLVFSVPKFSWSLKEQEVNPRKVYAIDPGLRNLMSFKFSDDMGKLFENAVFLQLLQNGEEVYYYSGKRECDFVTMRAGKPFKAVQVCYELNATNREREVAGLLEAAGACNLKDGTIITDNYEGVEKADGVAVTFLPLWKYLAG